MCESTFLENFKNRLWQTKEARFEASRRLLMQSRWSLWTITILSLYVIALTVFRMLGIEGELTQNHGDALGLLVSMLVVVISVFESSASYSTRGINMQKSALEIASLYDEICLAEAKEDNHRSWLKSAVARYHQILKMYPENHATGDYLFAVESRKLSNMGHSLDRSLLRFVRFVRVVHLYCFIVLLPIVLALFIWLS